MSLRQQDAEKEALAKELFEAKARLEIEEAKKPTSSSSDNKGWKSVVVTRMYEEKLRALEQDVEKKVLYIHSVDYLFPSLVADE